MATVVEQLRLHGRATSSGRSSKIPRPVRNEFRLALDCIQQLAEKANIFSRNHSNNRVYKTDSGTGNKSETKTNKARHRLMTFVLKGTGISNNEKHVRKGLRPVSTAVSPEDNSKALVPYHKHISSARKQESNVSIEKHGRRKSHDRFESSDVKAITNFQASDLQHHHNSAKTPTVQSEGNFPQLITGSGKGGLNLRGTAILPRNELDNSLDSTDWTVYMDKLKKRRSSRKITPPKIIDSQIENDLKNCLKVRPHGSSKSANKETNRLYIQTPHMANSDVISHDNLLKSITGSAESGGSKFTSLESYLTYYQNQNQCDDSAKSVTPRDQHRNPCHVRGETSPFLYRNRANLTRSFDCKVSEVTLSSEPSIQIKTPTLEKRSRVPVRRSKTFAAPSNHRPASTSGEETDSTVTTQQSHNAKRQTAFIDVRISEKKIT